MNYNFFIFCILAQKRKIMCCVTASKYVRTMLYPCTQTLSVVHFAVYPDPPLLFTPLASPKVLFLVFLSRSWEAVREKGIEYVSVSLMDMRHKLFIPSVENEQFLVELVKKVSFASKFKNSLFWVASIRDCFFNQEVLLLNIFHKPPVNCTTCILN